MRPIIKTRGDLADYILRRLGSPVNEIELSQAQLQDAIEDTLQRFIERAYDGIEERYLTLNLEAGVQDYVMDSSIEAVLDTIKASDLDVNYFYRTDYLYYTYNGIRHHYGLLDTELMRQYISSVKFMYDIEIAYTYNTTTKVLHIIETPASNSTIIIHCYRSPDIDSTDLDDGIQHIWNHRWIKAYATELARYQWGINLQKFEGSTLPNGLTINASAILDTAKENIEKLDEQLSEEYEDPYFFIVG